MDRPGAVLERLGPLLSFQSPPKIAPKNLQDASIFNGNPRLKLKKTPQHKNNQHFCIFSPPGCILTHHKGVLEPFLTVLGTSWRHLEPSGRHLGPSWGRILASQNPPKTAPRGLQDASQDEVQHRPQLGGLQGPFLVEILD